MVPEPQTRGNPLVVAKFFKRGNHDIVAISVIGDPNEAERKVTPKDIADWPKEWEAYQNGLELPPVIGTSLMEIPGFTVELERFYKHLGYQVCEQLAEATDGMIQRLGMNATNFRKSAKMIVENKKLLAMQAMMSAASAAQVPPKPRPDDDDEEEEHKPEPRARRRK